MAGPQRIAARPHHGAFDDAGSNSSVPLRSVRFRSAGDAAPLAG